MSIQLSRRHFLATSAAWAAGRAAGFCAETPDHKTISILHTTDLHGHILPTNSYSGITDVGGFARCATQIRRWRKENPDSLLVDIGDLYQGTAASYHNEGRLFVDLLANFEYDAWTLGNHDFDWGAEVLASNIKAAKIPILTANLTGAPEKVIPWRMKEVAGFKIALIGLVTPGLPFWLMPETLGGIAPSDPAIVLKKSIAQARSAKALFTQADHFGIHCGKIDLTFDVNSRKLIAKTAVTEYMDKRFDLDPGVINFSQPELKTAKEQLARVLTTLKEPILGKHRESPLARLLCKSFSEALRRNKTPVDALFHGTFGTPEIPAGPVTVADAWEILPYENTLITATITPAQLLEIIAEDRKTYSDRTLWPFEVVWEKRVPVRILDKGTELPAEKLVTIAFNSYDSQSGGHKLMRLREIIQLPTSKRQPIAINTRDALIEGFLNA